MVRGAPAARHAADRAWLRLVDNRRTRGHRRARGLRAQRGRCRTGCCLCRLQDRGWHGGGAGPHRSHQLAAARPRLLRWITGVRAVLLAAAALLAARGGRSLGGLVRLLPRMCLPGRPVRQRAHRVLVEEPDRAAAQRRDRRRPAGGAPRASCRRADPGRDPGRHHAAQEMASVRSAASARGSGNLSARYVLAVMIGARGAGCPGESLVGSHCRSPTARVSRAPPLALMESSALSSSRAVRVDVATLDDRHGAQRMRTGRRRS